MSYSDDRAPLVVCPGRSAGARPSAPGAERDVHNNQFSVPTVSPETGHLYVAFENFNTPDENQWFVVRSSDGGRRGKARSS